MATFTHNISELIRENQKIYILELTSNEALPITLSSLIIEGLSFPYVKSVAFEMNQIEYEFSKKHNSYYLDIADIELNHFKVSIKVEENANIEALLLLKIKYNFDNREYNESIDVEIINKQAPPEIVVFNGNKDLIFKNHDALILHYQIIGKFDEMRLYRNHIDITKNVIHKDKTMEVDFENCSSGCYKFDLELKANNTYITKSLSVVYADKSEIRIPQLPKNWKVLNFCSSPNEDILAALVDDQGVYKICLTKSLEDSWETYEIEQNLITSFIYSPMVFLPISGNSKGKVVFVGGNMFKIPKDNPKYMLSIHLDFSKESGISSSIRQEMLGLPSGIYGHACFVYLDNLQNNTIGIYGGRMYNQSINNALYTSTDGISWQKTISNENNYPKGVMPSFAVKNHKSCFFFGGFKDSSYESVAHTIYSLNTDLGDFSEVKIVESLKNSFASGIASGLEESYTHKGLFVFGNDLTDNVLKIWKVKQDDEENPNLEITLDSTTNIENYRPGRVITATFKDCIWFMRVYYAGSLGYNYSNLQYRVPFPTETII